MTTNNELKKSLQSILYERTTSPFYGTLIISWVIWNWRIIYLTLFVSEEKINTNKIDYIISNYSDICHILIYPLISTIILITLVPFITNGAYWISLIFNRWKKNRKHIVEKNQLLSLEQSIELREQISEQEIKFEKLLDKEKKEIERLKQVNESYQTQFIEQEKNNKTLIENYKSEILKLQTSLTNSNIESNDLKKELAKINKAYDILLKESEKTRKESEESDKKKTENFATQLNKLLNENKDLINSNKIKEEKIAELAKGDNEITELAELIKSKQNYLNDYKKLSEYIQNKWKITADTFYSNSFLTWLESSDIITEETIGHYYFTEKGKSINRLILLK